MTNFNKLEQLNRLRESGALTESEFASEKEKLLSATRTPEGRGVRRLLLGAGVALAILLAAIVVTYVFKPASQPTTNPDTSYAVNSAPIVAEDRTEEVHLETPVAASSGISLSWAMGPTVIGLNPAFLESKLGPAREKSSSLWVFEVSGCTVSYDVEGDAIVAAGMPVSARCSPQIDGRTITPSTTFSSIRGSTGTVQASCISNCGNAYDPTIDIHHDGYRANGFIETLYSSNHGEAQSAATELWRRSIRASHGLPAEGYDNEGDWFGCVSRPPAEVLAALGPETVGYVRIGRGLDRDGPCRFG